jgi:hypothetical protein
VGQEIVYCFNCSSRIVGGEGVKHGSYTIGNRAACADCASKLLLTLPDDQREQLLAQINKSATSKTARAVSKRTPRGGTEAVPGASAPGSKTPLVLAAVAAVIVLIIGIAMSGNTPSRIPDPVVAPPPPERRTDKPVVVPPPPPKENLQAELARIEESVAGANRQENFKEALDYLASARKRRDTSEWTGAVDRIITKANTEVSTLYTLLEGMAIDARRRGAESEVVEITARIDRWKLPERTAALKKSLETLAATPFRQGADGIVCLEAEHAAAQTPLSGHTWTRVQLPAGFEGDGALAALPNDGGQWLTDYPATAPRMDFKVDFVKTGAHYVWIRASGDTDKDNSVHLGFDGQAVPTLKDLGWSATKKFVWSNKQMNGKTATFTVPAIGAHTINVWCREDGAVVDRIVLTTDSKWGPKGNGPPESSR